MLDITASSSPSPTTKIKAEQIKKGCPTAQAPFNWRAHLRVHPAAEQFPLLSETDPAAFKELVDNIKVNGLIEPIVFWYDRGHPQSLLDGRNRLDALATLGLLYETEDCHLGIKKWAGQQWSNRRAGRIEARSRGYCYLEGDPYEIALSLNVHRRHLTHEQKRDLIANVLKAKPEKSNNQIAKEVKADDKTVAKVRADLESRSEIPNVDTRTDTRGRKQPAKRKGKEGKNPPDLTKFAEISIEQRRTEHAALEHNGAPAPLCIPAPADQGATLDSLIEHDWHEAKGALEILTAHPVTQVAQMLSAGEIALVTEFADYLADLVTKLARTPVENADKKRKASTLIDCWKKRMAFAWIAASETERKSFVDYLRRDVS